jgi:DNA-binding transcriptional regulator PaaX
MDPHTLLLWESSTPNGIRTVDLVKQAWDFLKINESYDLVIQRALQSRRPEKIREATLLWHRALAGDPLLPRELYPKDYLGFKTMDVLRKIWLKHISDPN